jgi:PPOX class probable F420-dependent enzyme
LSFIGFDAAATLGEETRNPRRNVPLAVAGALGVIALAYPLYSVSKPGQAYPYNYVPWVVLAWIVIGAALYAYYRAKSPAKIAAEIRDITRSPRWSAAGSCTARSRPCYRAGMGIRLSESAIRLIDGRNYAVLATVNADGSPQTSVMWVGRDGDDLLFSTVEGRLKHRNMVRDPRVSVTVIDSADPENYVELRGTASMTPDIGRRFDTELSWKYDGKDPGQDRPGAVRVVVRVEVLKAAGYGA